MKKNYNFILWYLWIIILLSCLILFSITSLALIPGDFGSAGGGPPDGVVDFEDLMIFAMAYGATSADANWNPNCDLYPDGVIDFEDLMVFAMNYGERESSVHNLTKDTYYNTIQAALNDADTDNTIEVADGTHDESITFPLGKMIVLRSVNGPSSTIIRGDDGLNTVTFNSSPEGTILEGFTITHTNGQIGSGIYIGSGYLNIDNCTISDNIVNNVHATGGGIANRGSLDITGSTISGNSSSNSGGGISNQGTLTIASSTISDNSAGDYGGGIHNCYHKLAVITGSTISSNSVSGEGGGIRNDGTLTIASSTIYGNSAGEWGGGISNSYLYLDTLTITSSTISGNSASIDGGGISIFSDPVAGTIIVGGNSVNEKNIICGNYKSNYSPSLDQQIRDYIYGNLYEIYKDTNYISADCTVIPNETVYRAFLVGVGDYVEDTYDLPEPPYDVDRMDYVLSQCSFGPSNTQFSIISPLKDLSATKSAILQGIASVFSGSDDNDISYFYFSGHGYLDSDTNISYLCPTDTTLVLDLSTMISIDELETALSAIAGTKVVFIGACHSGGFI